MQNRQRRASAAAPICLHRPRTQRLLTMLLVLSLQASTAQAQTAQLPDRAGDRFEIQLDQVSKSSGDDGSSASSSDRDVLVERVVAVRDEGVELEFDLPADASSEDRKRSWQFPARVFKSPGQPLELLNAADAERRLTSWLGKKGRAVCGRWIFTWTATKIDCDPQSVLQNLEPYLLQPNELRDGALYSEAAAREPAPLRAESSSSNGQHFVAKMELDPNAMRRQRAETDVAVAEMTGKRVSFEAAMKARSGERLSGTIVATFETDATGRVTRRTRVTQSEIVRVNGAVERTTTTETADRRAVSRSRLPPQ